MANVKRAALAKARERRLALDRDRESRDSRVEQAAAQVFLGVEQRHAAEREVHDANLGIGKALVELLAERIALEDIAELCDLDTAEVRRLVRLPALASSGAGADRPDAATPAGAVDGAADPERGAGPATVTQLRRRPLETDTNADTDTDTDTDVDAVAVAVAVAVPVPVSREADGAAPRAE